MKLPPQGICYYDCTTKTKGGGRWWILFYPFPSVGQTIHIKGVCIFLILHFFIWIIIFLYF